MSVDLHNVVETYDALSHPGLVRHNEKLKMFREAIERCSRIPEEYHVRGITQVPPILDQGPVSVQKNGWSQMIMSPIQENSGLPEALILRY
jgi:hypothetical protein